MVEASQRAGHIFVVIILQNKGVHHNIFNLYCHYWTRTLAVPAMFLSTNFFLCLELFDWTMNRNV